MMKPDPWNSYDPPVTDNHLLILAGLLLLTFGGVACILVTMFVEATRFNH